MAVGEDWRLGALDCVIDHLPHNEILSVIPDKDRLIGGLLPADVTFLGTFADQSLLLFHFNLFPYF